VRGLFITGTDTGAGKSLLSAALLAAISAAGERVRAHKPVVTGLDATGEEPWPADHELLARAAGMRPQEVSPLRYGPAVSPHLAAELAGERIELEPLLAAVHHDGSDLLIVEGIGGLLTPLSEDLTVCDYATALGLPILIAARPGLGTLNHTLLTLRAARMAGLSVRAVVLTPWPEQPSELELSNRLTIARMGHVEVAGLARAEGSDRAELARVGTELPWRSWLSGAVAQPAGPALARQPTAALT
jgi:dethiobiotin synthetase